MGKVKAGSRPVEAAAVVAAQQSRLTKKSQSDLKARKKSWTSTVIMLLPATVAPSHLNNNVLLPLLHT